MTDQAAPLSEPAVEEGVRHRRLVDKINAAALHAFDQGRREIADKLRLLHDAVVGKEIEDGYADRSDSEIKKMLDHRFKNEMTKKRIRPRAY